MRRILVFIAVTALALIAAAALLIASVWRDEAAVPDDGRTASPSAPPAASSPSSSSAPSPPAAPPPVRLTRLQAGPFAFPVYVTAPPDDRGLLFIVERAGTVRVVRDGVALPRPLLDIAGLVSTEGEGGLLSLACAPDWAETGRFTVYYTDNAGDIRIVQYTAAAPQRLTADPGSGQTLLRIPHPTYANHVGGQLQYGPDARLYVGVGDGGGAGDPAGNAQNQRSPLGKIWRVTPSAKPSAAVYARGVRNPWRFSFDAATGGLWIADVGQDRREEVNYLEPGHPPGANLGWNAFEGREVYEASVAGTLDRDSLVWPVAEYGHALGNAIVGGYVYRGTAIPTLRGWYVFGDYGSGRIWAMRGPRGTPLPLPGADRAVDGITSFGEDAAGELYVATPAGDVYRVTP